MAFELIEKTARGASPPTGPEFRLGYHTSSTGAGKTIYFAFSRPLIDQLGWPVNENADGRISVTFLYHEGTKEDAGFFMLVPDPKGFTAGTNKGKRSNFYSMGTSISASRLKNYAVNDPTIEKQTDACEFVINDDGSLLVQLPEWMRYCGPPADEKPPAPEVKKETPAPRPTPHQRAMRVTNEVAAEVADVIPLNRRDRRQIASKVARALSK